MFRFTIRDALWLMVVVALSLTLWNERQKLSKAKTLAPLASFGSLPLTSAE